MIRKRPLSASLSHTDRKTFRFFSSTLRNAALVLITNLRSDAQVCLMDLTVNDWGYSTSSERTFQDKQSFYTTISHNNAADKTFSRKTNHLKVSQKTSEPLRGGKITHPNTRH